MLLKGKESITLLGWMNRAFCCLERMIMRDEIMFKVSRAVSATVALRIANYAKSTRKALATGITQKTRHISPKKPLMRRYIVPRGNFVPVHKLFFMLVLKTWKRYAHLFDRTNRVI